MSDSDHPQLIVCSNRLPYSVSQRKGEWHYSHSSGGLVTALEGLKAKHEFHWVGWPGRDVPQQDQEQVRQHFQSSLNCTPVFLPRDEIKAAYNGFCNQVIWPLFHYFASEVRVKEEYWRAYQEMNLRFASAITEIAKPGDLVWIHDFHLMLVPELLKRQRADLKIGFFLHIPFPSSEMYRLLAVRQEILRGLLGADLIGFHSYDYLRHFGSACLRLLGLEAQPTSIDLKNRQVRLGVFPIGIDADRFTTTLKSKACQVHMKRLRRTFKDRKIILGVDRMDYTKGIPLKLKAFERFLEKNPKWRSEVMLYQVAVPSREDVHAYQQLKEEVDELVGRINGKYGTLEQTPIYYLNKSVSLEHLCALYATADIALLTPIRDGMNLVAQEYVLCSGEKPGRLILSEFAGSAHSLSGCLLVNPWNVKEVVSTLETALEMSDRDWQRRNVPMYHFVIKNSAARWGERFVHELQQDTTEPNLAASSLNLEVSEVRTDLLGSYRSASHRQLFLDYDGTLTPIRPTPGEAIPGHNLMKTLKRLASDPRNQVHIVSGRDRHELEEWFDQLPISLCAEHGFVYRDKSESQWQGTEDIDLSWKDGVKDVLEYFSERTPGAIIEDKPSSLSWHYRRTDPAFGQWQADELLIHLEEILAQLRVEAIKGHKVIEVRPLGIHKGRYLQHILAQNPATDFILCIGDDQTDEDMYKTLPPDAWTCHIGSPHTAARYFLDSQEKAIALLESFSPETDLA